MSKKANPAIIGAFVLVALAIAASTLVILGSGRFLKKTARHVIFFESSLSGLDVGAPVEYHGVRIGQVASISLEYNSQTSEVLIPVYVDLEDSRFRYVGDRKEHKDLTYHIEQGLRAQLQAQSLVTGKQKVMLVDKPDSPMRMVGGDPSTPEIPAIPTVAENISQSLGKLPIAKIIANLDVSMKQIADFASSGELTNAILHLDGALKEIEGLSRSLNKELPDLLASVRQNSDDFVQVQKNLDAMLREIRDLLTSRSPERQQLVTTLQSIEDTSNSLRNLIDYLQVHPEALLSGKKEERP